MTPFERLLFGFFKGYDISTCLCLVIGINPYPANVDNMGSFYQC